ncbi:MAG: hypothetical protein ACP5J4_11025 [Anaerolineae bacterium]
MSSSRRCEILKEHLTRLYEDYNAVVGQMGRVLGALDETHLERQMAELEAKIEVWEEKVRLCELGAAQATAQHQYTDPESDRQTTTQRCRKILEANIPKIDFTEILDTLTQITNRIRAEQGGAALFMLQNANSMGGQLCVQRMQQLLNEQTRDFRHIEIGQAMGDRLDSWTVMRKLGEYLNCAPPNVAEVSPLHLKEYARTLGERLEGAVQYGSVVLLEIRTWDDLVLPDVFLPWFVHEFWVPLVQRLPFIVQKKPRVTVIGVIMAQTPVQMEAIDPALQCCSDTFDPTKMLPLPLRYWEEAEIRDWILDYSGLGDPAVGVELVQIETMAKRIYTFSKGEPTRVHQALLEAIEGYYNTH